MLIKDEELKEKTFLDLVGWATQRVHDGLLKDGTEGVREAIVNCFDVVLKWRYYQEQAKKMSEDEPECEYDRLLKKYSDLSPEEKVIVLRSALDYMQQHNCRSVSDCIVLAQGGSYRE